MNLKKISLSIARRNILRKIGYGHCGRKSIIYRPLLINNKKGIYLGDDVSFLDGARIEVINNSMKNIHGIIEIGNNTSFEQCDHIISGAKLTIGQNCVFSARVFITTAEHSYERINENVLYQEILVQDTKIGNYCFIGMDVKIFPGVTIGDNLIIGANSLVTHDIPSYSVAVGSPAKVIKKYNFEKQLWEKC